MTEIEKEGAQGTPEPTVEELTKKIEELTTERDNVVGELKDDREKRQQLQEELETTKSALTEATQANVHRADGNDVAAVAAQVVEKVLADRDASTAKDNKSVAVERFVAENPAFNAENDPTGKLREALTNKIATFNTEGMTTVEQFSSVVRDAARLLGADTTPTDSGEPVVTPYASTTPASATPKPATADGLSEKEMKLIEANGYTIERYNELKAKMPDTIADLLSRIN